MSGSDVLDSGQPDRREQRLLDKRGWTRLSGRDSAEPRFPCPPGETMSRLGILFAAGLIVAAQAIAADGPPALPGTASKASLGSRGLKVSGHITNLQPGQARRIRVRVRNRLQRPVVLHRLRAIPTGDPVRCPASSLRVQRFRGRLPIRPRGLRVVRLRIRLSPAASDGCKRFAFGLRYRASAGAARRPR